MLVIVPIFNAYDALVECLNALATYLPINWQVQLIDDASTDQRIKPFLEKFVSDKPTNWKLSFQSKNLGFIRTVNHAMQRTDKDVVLLNSDALVTPYALGNIIEAAQSDLLVATVTPFSNNAEICSFPNFCMINQMPSNLKEVGVFFNRYGTKIYPKIPTAVGFCMYIKRAIIDQIGLFDATTFGHGYGEENDFCFRASAAGYYHILCDNAYVAHVGSQSFNESSHQKSDNALNQLLKKHPNYLAVIEAFIKEDPIKSIRQQMMGYLPDQSLFQ